MDRLQAHLPRHPLGRHLVGLAGVAAITGILELALDGPSILAVGAPYQLWVLVVSGLFGAAVGLVTSLAAVAALNWFFISPIHTFSVDDSGNWVSLGLFAATALITSQLAAAARRQQEEEEARRRDAELLATLARYALAGIGSGHGVDEVASAAAKALGVSHCEITLGGASPAGGGPTRLSPSARGFAIPLVAEDGLLGLLEVGPSVAGREPRWRRPGFADAVATLVSLAVERSRLLDQALETESLRRSDELKTALLRTVSHEFRTPLTAIRTAGEALAEPAPADGEALVAVVRDETERLERLVANLLDLSRLEAGALSVRLDWCDPTELVAGSVEAAAALLEGHPVAVDLGGELPLVRADAVLCERILLNLLHNAARHGAPPITISGRESGDRLELAVSDGGSGVAPALRAHLFEPFVSGARGGTGVGLALSRGLAEAQGGTLRLEAGERTRFVLALPLEPVPEVVDG